MFMNRIIEPTSITPKQIKRILDLKADLKIDDQQFGKRIYFLFNRSFDNLKQLSFRMARKLINDLEEKG